jgi:uncharacterized protein YdiU (UPF0061 family)
LLAQWQAVGFCHGVMNTDNMSLLGLTIDYGPFQFMDSFDPGHICNHSDYQGRYAYGRQPNVAYWNLYALAQALAPLIDDQEMTLQVLEAYKTQFPRYLGDAMRAKLGLVGDLAPESEREADWILVEDLMQLMAAEKVDFTLFWRQLSHAVVQQARATEPTDSAWSAVTDQVLDRPRLLAWLQRFAVRAGPSNFTAMGQHMLKSNPKFVLRNHLAEVAIRQAQAGDFSEIETLYNLLKFPFDEHPGFEAYADLPPDWASQLEISCSS